MAFVARHREVNADITIGCLPIDEERASDFGLMKIENTGRITEFAEKPEGAALKAMAVDTSILGLSTEEAKASPYIASMGIYVFKKSALLAFLNSEYPKDNDFGGEIIPKAAADGYHVQAYLFNDYWEDIGTIGAFYEANLALTQQPTPPFSFYDEAFPIYTRPRYLPPSKFVDSQITDSIISEGSIIKACSIHHSVLGVRSRVENNVVLQDSLLMGADFFESQIERETLRARGGIPVGVGEGTTVKRAILDKNARLGKNVTIVNKDHVEEADRPDQGFYIRNGIIVVVKNASIPDDTVI